jgi:dihydropteroate synthase
MHMQGEPGTMQREPRYGDVVGEVMAFLAARAAAARAAGVAAVAVDPGIGFGKTLDHNLALLSATGMEALGSLGYPVLIGLSRKRFLAELEERRAAPRPDVLTLAASRDGLSKAWELRAADRGAILIRSHRAPGETPPEPVDFPPES